MSSGCVSTHTFPALGEVYHCCQYRQLLWQTVELTVHARNVRICHVTVMCSHRGCVSINASVAQLLACCLCNIWQLVMSVLRSSDGHFALVTSLSHKQVTS